MRKKKLGMRITSALLALAMMTSFTFQDVTSLKANAAELNTTQEISTETDTEEAEDALEVSEDEESLDDENVSAFDGEEEDGDDGEDGDEEDGDDGEEGDGEEDIDEPEVPEILNAFNRYHFQDILAWDALANDNEENVAIDAEKREDGIIITGKNKEIKKTVFTVEKAINFDGETPDRFMINVVAKRGTKTYIKCYLDDETEPFAESRVAVQKQENDWTRNQEMTFDISSMNLSGEHTLHFTVEDTDTADKKETIFLLRSFAFIRNTLPVVNLKIDESYGPIDGMNNDGDHATECYGNVEITVPEGYKNEIQEEKGIETPYTGGEYKLDYIRGRGNSTWYATKKPYKIKLDDKADLFNMGANKHWVLLANYYDKSLLRNRMTYWLGRELKMPYTPECVSVDVYMNDEYLGNYLLCEQIRVGKDRVDITDMEDEFAKNPENVDLTGGYLLSMEPYGNEFGYAFRTNEGHHFYIESPESDYGTTLDERGFGYRDDDYYFSGAVGMLGDDEEVDDEDLPEYEPEVDTSPYAAANEYITNYVQMVEDAINSSDWSITNEAGEKVHYSDLLDVDQAVAYYWIQEFSVNGDAYGTDSTFLYKEKNGKLCWGPLWDFDFVAWASTIYEDDEEYYDQSYQGWRNQNVWFGRLMEDPAFVAKVKEYYNEKLRPAMEKVVADDGVLDQYEKEIEASANHNYEKWDGLGDAGFMFYGSQGNTDYSIEVPRLKRWIENRMNWVDDNLDTIEPRPVEIHYMVDGKEVDVKTAFLDKNITEVAEEPEKEGYQFAGWFCVSKYEGSEKEYELLPYESSVNETCVNEDGVIIAYAKWIDEKDIKDAEGIHITQKDFYTYYMSFQGWVDCFDFDIPYAVYPSNARYASVTWTSSDEDIATVDETGHVIPTGKGDVVITATLDNGASCSANVHVMGQEIMDYEFYDVSRSDIALSDEAITMNTNDVKTLTVKSVPEKAMYPSPVIDVIWQSSNKEVATVENGIITAHKPGVAVIMAICRVGDYDSVEYKVQSCTVTVKGAEDNKDINKPGDTTKPGNVTKPSAATKPGTTTKPDTTTATTEAAKTTVKVNTKFVLKNLKYTVTKASDNQYEVAVTGMKKKKSKVTIPATVSYKGTTFNVTSVAKKAFANNKKLTKVVIGKNMVKIGSKAFYNCKKLKTVEIKSTQLKKPGSKAFKKLPKKAKIILPKDKFNAYRKWFDKDKVYYRSGKELYNALNTTKKK